MDYKPAEFWDAHGPYLATESVGPEHLAQEAILRSLFSELSGIRSVIDVGCGRGRLAAVLKDALPRARYTGLDIGPAQLEATQRVRPEGQFIQSRLQDFSDERQWDLVLCSEVLLHIPPEDIQQACANLKSMARKYLITVDWTQKLSVPTAAWNFLYDYHSLLGQPDREIRTGTQSVFLFQIGA